MGSEYDLTTLQKCIKILFPAIQTRGLSMEATHTYGPHAYAPPCHEPSPSCQHSLVWTKPLSPADVLLILAVGAGLLHLFLRALRLCASCTACTATPAPAARVPPSSSTRRKAERRAEEEGQGDGDDQVASVFLEADTYVDPPTYCQVMRGIEEQEKR